MTQVSGAELLVRCLEAYEIPYIFTVPGAAIDPILDVLVDHGPEIILCRHEQNATFMAQAWGRLTGQPGVVLATAGPGLTNLVTGLATADAERCPVIAITGQVAQNMRFKRGHQNIEAAQLLSPVCKRSDELYDVTTLASVFGNAYRTAITPREGPCHISIPVNILGDQVDPRIVAPSAPQQLAHVGGPSIDRAVELINEAENPILFVGIAASKPQVSHAVRSFLSKIEIPVVGTFESAGAISRDLLHRFIGRLGVFPNQPGDAVLKEADLVITVGYDIVEYDPNTWNAGLDRPIIHIDEIPATVSRYYHPEVELTGEICCNLGTIEAKLDTRPRTLSKRALQAREQLTELQESGATHNGTPIHPLRFVYELRKLVDDETTVITDVGSHQYWMARNFFCYEPLHFLTSMGFQTMGVSIPWAIATTLARPGKKVVSISGDGSFLMCSMELETAVRLQSPIIHFVWEEGTYNLVKIQQEQKYGRDSATRFGQIDTVAYAEAMGATAFRIDHPDQIAPTFHKALEVKGPVVVSLPVDYSDNKTIVETISHGP